MLVKNALDVKGLRFGTLCEFKLSDNTDQLTIEGYGSVFGNVDSYGDVVAKGAFTQTLSDWKSGGKLPKMLLQHGGSMFGGTAEDMTPVGVWSDMHEDMTGLYCKGRLLNTTRGRDTFEAAKAGALDGLSIGYIAKKWSRGAKPDEPRRTIEAAHLMEVSLVTFPANPKATIGATGKGLVDLDRLATAQTVREIEDALRDAGASKAEALSIVSRLKAASSRRDAGDSVESGMAATLAADTARLFGK